MDLVAFGFVALVLAIVGLLVSLAMGIRYAVDQLGERRYIARNAQYARRARIAA